MPAARSGNCDGGSPRMAHLQETHRSEAQDAKSRSGFSEASSGNQ